MDILKIGVLPIRDRKLLLCKKRGIEALIALGGKLETGETDEQCARRETREEAQCELSDIKYFGTASGRRIDTPGIITMRCYLAELDGEPQPRPEDKVYAFEWIDRHYPLEQLPHTMQKIVESLIEQDYI